MDKKFVLICLFNFFVAALMGLALRFVFFHPLNINFRFLTHAHSHVAMLGWVYLMLYILIVHYFIPEKKRIYTTLFWLTQVAVVGMMLSFPFQGYATFSIIFSTLHIFCSYYFVKLVWKHHQVKYIASRRLLKASQFFMVVSTIGVWCLGPAVGILGQTSAFYQIAIQFFLHFQFNGWFLFAILALFLHQFPITNATILFPYFFKLLIVATMLTFALPISWFAFHPILLWVNGVGVFLQILAGFFLIKLLQPHWRPFWKKTPYLIRSVYALALISFMLKILFQFLSVIPEIAQMAYQYRNFVIGFIHLMMLGIITGFLFAFILNSSMVRIKSKLLKLGVYFFIVGFIGTEFLLLAQGIYFYLGLGMMPGYNVLLFLFSIFLPTGILCFIINISSHGTKTFKTT